MAVATLAHVRKLEAVEVPRGSTATAGETIIALELHHGQALFGFVRRQGLSDSEAQDAVQEVLLRLWREMDGGRYIANPRAWAYRTIYRLAMDEHRLRRRLAELGKRLIPTTGPVGGDADDRIAVWAEVDRLPKRQRQVLYLRYRSDLPFDDIAAVLGITPGAARSHATQAMATLRKRLSGQERV